MKNTLARDAHRNDSDATIVKDLDLTEEML